eukprot:8539295-Alexandrium_andersonii.AAC.1
MSLGSTRKFQRRCFCGGRQRCHVRTRWAPRACSVPEHPPCMGTLPELPPRCRHTSRNAHP